MAGNSFYILITPTQGTTRMSTRGNSCKWRRGDCQTDRQNGAEWDWRWTSAVVSEKAKAEIRTRKTGSDFNESKSRIIKQWNKNNRTRAEGGIKCKRGWQDILWPLQSASDVVVSCSWATALKLRMENQLGLLSPHFHCRGNSKDFPVTSRPCVTILLDCFLLLLIPS